MTEEGLNYLMALTHFGRLRFASNLMPLLQKATGLRRVVSAFTGAKEGQVYTNAWQQGQETKIPLSAIRGHGATMSENSRLFPPTFVRVNTTQPSVWYTHGMRGESSG